jgi:hypothetical protein
MDRVCTRHQAGLDDRRDMQIAAVGGWGADQHCLIGQLDWSRASVSFRIDLNGPDAEIAAGPNNPQRNLPAVADKDLSEHLHLPFVAV